MSPLLLRLLIYMYTNQKLQVRWSTHVGDTFVACNGVKQGGVLSPILFSVYIRYVLRIALLFFLSIDLADHFQVKTNGDTVSTTACTSQGVFVTSFP